MNNENGYQGSRENYEQKFMLESLLNEIPGGVAVYKVTDKLECLYFSDGYAQISGRTREEIARMNREYSLIDEVVAESDRERFLETVYRLTKKEEHVNMSFRYVAKDGSIGWLHVSASKMREEDGYPIYYCVFTIPSEESALYRRIVEDSASGVVVVERKTRRVLYMNQALCKLFNVSEEVVRKGLKQSKPVKKEYIFLSDEDVQTLDEEVYSEFHKKWKNLYLGIKAKAMEWNGVKAYIMYFADETAEYEQQAHLQKLVDEVPGGIGIGEIRNGQVAVSYLNKAYYAMLGMDREKRKQYYGKNALEAIYKDDRAKIMEGVRMIMEGEDKVTVLHRVCNHAGEWIWLSLVASVIERKRDFIRFYASFSDCDKMMRTQQELQDNKMILNAALESVQVMEWKYDFKKNIITDSGIFGEFYRLPKVVKNVAEIFIGDGKNGLVHEDSVKDFLWMHEHAGDGKRIQRDIRGKSEDGKSYVWKRIIFTPLENENGECTEIMGTSVDITEQKEREQNYEEQLRLKKIVTKNAIAVIHYNLTRDFAIEIECKEEKITKNVNDDTVDEILKVVTELMPESEDFPRNSKELMALYTEKNKKNLVLRHYIKNDVRCFESTFDMISNPYTKDVEVTIVLRDVTEAVRAEQVVTKLLAIDFDSIMTLDAKSGVAREFSQFGLYENRTAKVVVQQESIGGENKGASHLQEYITPENAEKMNHEHSLAYIRQQLEHMQVYENLFLTKKDGRTLHKRVLYAYLEEKKDNILCAIQDVTDTYEQEEEQKNILAQALKDAKEANHAKSDFLSRMSHDMRTPMNGILGLADLSLEETDVEILKRNFYKVKESGSYLLSLINDTLDFQRIESGKLQLNPRIAYVRDVMDNIMEIINPMLETKKLNFYVNNINADSDWHARVDAVRYKQILINLLSNAIKFTPDGGEIELGFEHLGSDGMISHERIYVRDTGIGMSEEFLRDKMFKPFSQESNDMSAKYAGTGLGLSIVKSLVELMGGTIEVESKLGEGTKFTICLDFERVDQEEAQKVQKTSEHRINKMEESLANKKILLIEDHPLNAEIAMKLLEKVGCQIVWRDDGKKGVQEFEHSQMLEYQAVLMDIRMPVMNGLDAARAIRALPREDAQTVPIIAMTANAYDEDVEKSKAAGMNAHLAKPIEPTKLYGTLAREMAK